MAMAVFRLASIVLRALPRVLRAKSLLTFLSSRQEVNTIFKFRDLVDYLKSHKDIKDYVKKQLFNVLETHNFIFDSYDELKEYILRIDSRAKIVKVLELKEVDLYIVEFSDVRLFLNIQDEGIFQQLATLGYVNQITIWMNYFLTYSLAKLREKVDNYIQYMENEKNSLKSDVDNIISYWKAKDIANTYCIDCCCSCEEGSCCCSCNLVHYVQSWDNAKNEIKSTIDNYFLEMEEELKREFIDKTNDNSYIILFLSALAQLLFNMKEKSRNRLLFAVLKEKNILEIEKKEYKKTGVMRAIYEFLEEIRGKKIEYDKLILELQNYLLWKLNKKYTYKQVQVLFNTAIRQYHFRKIKLKRNNKVYVVIV